MSETIAQHMSELESPLSLEELFANLLDQEPKPIANFVPTDAAEQKELFLSGAVLNPNHQYDKLAAIDFKAKRENINRIGEQILGSSDANPKYAEVYEQFIQNYINKTNLMELVNASKTAETDEEKVAAKEAFMKMNIELYGEPDESTYRSILSEKIAKINEKELSESGIKIRDELIELVGQENLVGAERFRPSDDTVEWMKSVADSLYGSLLEHVPDQDNFIDTEVQAIFETIMHEEFGESAAGWAVDVENAQSINVKAAEKRIVIPKGRELSQKTMRGLVVHEIGVHFMRSVMGDQTDLLPLKLGLSDYYDTEEGLGAVMEQALVGKYHEAGVDHYVTAGLAHFDDKDFRETFEIKWRLALLSSAKEEEISDEAIEKARNTAYGGTMRIMRGTDDMPWFKDLSYYNGAAEVWKHLESIKGDDLEFMFVLLGKANAANPLHKRILLETATPSRDDKSIAPEVPKV